MNQYEAQAQAAELEDMIHTIGQLASIAIDQSALDGSSPGPQLDAEQIEATLRAALFISKDAHTKFCSLMTALKVPA